MFHDAVQTLGQACRRRSSGVNNRYLLHTTGDISIDSFNFYMQSIYIGISTCIAQKTPIFTGDVTVTPTCTYLGTYSLSPSSCGNVVLTYSDGSVILSSENNGDGWFLSAVTTLGVEQDTGTIRTGSGSSSGNLIFDQNGATLQVSSSGTSFIPEAVDPQDANANGFCSQIRLKDPSSGLYVSVGDCEGGGFILAEANNSSTIWNVNTSSSFELIENHEEDANVTAYLTDSNIVFYSLSPNTTEVAQNTFPEGFAHVGLNDENMVIGFVCPQSTVDNLTVEVQIGQVGGMVDASTGAAYIVLDEVYWLVFGDLPGKYSLDKENGLKVVLGNVTGGTQLVLPTATTSDTPENTAITVVVPAVTQNPPANTTKEELALIKAVSKIFTSMQPGSEVFWALYMEAPKSSTGAEYEQFANDANQGVGPGGIASSPSSSTSPSSVSSGCHHPRTTSLLVLGALLSLLSLV